ncbi:hypothetical protein [Sandaracinus amylolyticus]|uniref:hypothetical protein n=1 Tax=Sandaracinus amylolyticus TaxID=927083 RepID=UPI001F1E2002|nr:hypothetical protein [Sandaracinus amylolyticus]UJR80185.1 Hypothetical protein I5071_22290 [Sandaracinus amylolyticus]
MLRVIVALAALLLGCAEPVLPERAVIIVDVPRARLGLPGASWTPSPADVLALERGLEAYLTSRGELGLAGRWPRDWRQYTGIETEGGSRLVIGSFACRLDGPPELQRAFREHWISVNDGGDCFFTVHWDATRETFTALTKNGDA